MPVVITNMIHYRDAVELQVSWYCSCLLLSQIWYTIGEQLNYRSVDIEAACFYHKYITIWGKIELQVSLHYHKPKITENRLHLNQKLRYISSDTFTQQPLNNSSSDKTCILCFQNKKQLLFLHSLYFHPLVPPHNFNINTSWLIFLPFHFWN